jgi:hypothetical protein
LKRRGETGKKGKLETEKGEEGHRRRTEREGRKKENSPPAPHVKKGEADLPCAVLEGRSKDFRGGRGRLILHFCTRFRGRGREKSEPGQPRSSFFSRLPFFFSAAAAASPTFEIAMAGPTSSDVQPRPPSRPPRERDRPPRRKRPAGPEKHRHGLADDIESPWQNGIRVRFFLTLMD